MRTLVADAPSASAPTPPAPPLGGAGDERPAGPSSRGGGSGVGRPSGPSPRSRLLASSAWTTGVMLASVLITFFVSPIVVAALGDERYGVWAIVMSMTGYLGIADLG